jgi:hypothetical protein
VRALRVVTLGPLTAPGTTGGVVFLPGACTRAQFVKMVCAAVSGIVEDGPFVPTCTECQRCQGCQSSHVPGLRLVRSLLLVEKVSRELAGGCAPERSKAPIGFRLGFLKCMIADSLLGFPCYISSQVVRPPFSDLATMLAAITIQSDDSTFSRHGSAPLWAVQLRSAISTFAAIFPG